MAWLTAAQALTLLGVRPQTLYANVSRHRIRARPDPADPRRSLYHERDVRRLAGRRSGARKAERVASEAIEWGDPVLPSGLSTVAHGRLWYRGEDAVRLAETRTLEDVAGLLWGAPGVRIECASEGPPAARRRATARGIDRSASFLSRAFVRIATRAAVDLPSHGRTPTVLRAEAASVLSTVANSILDGGMGKALHERLAAHWRSARAADLLRRALVLLADHELNASTFAARVTISTGASLASGVLAGLATLSGPLHGRASLGVDEMLRAGRDRSLRTVVREGLEQGRPASGFGHPLYPEGDVRAQALLERFDPPARFEELRVAVEEIAGERPNIDYALAALREAFRLPAEAPLTLFALARSVGWLAHGLEQAAAGRLIRPRARYTGPAVG